MLRGLRRTQNYAKMRRSDEGARALFEGARAVVTRLSPEGFQRGAKEDFNMFDFEKYRSFNEISELMVEDFINGSSGRKLRITRDVYPRVAAGNSYSTVGSALRSGTVIEHYQDGGQDSEGVKWYRILVNHNRSIGYIPSTCCNVL